MRPLTFIVFLLIAVQIAGQDLCTGTLGDNIFADGNFGNGTAIVLEQDPFIAPDYNFVNRLPDDGQYTITSNLEALQPWDTWIRIKDNSDDDDGYFMVINASFEPGIFYEQTVKDVCPNTLYEFSADIINLIYEDVDNHIFPDVSFLINDEEIYSTGDILQTETWNKYGFTFTTGDNDNELTLTLRNNAPGGGGNDLALDNISFLPCGPEVEIKLISNDTINCSSGESVIIEANISDEWNINWQFSNDGFNWDYIPSSENQKTLVYNTTGVGVEYFRYLTGLTLDNTLNNKCYAISDTLSLKIIGESYSYKDTICRGEIYELGELMLRESGFYSHRISNPTECDNIVNLELFVLPYARDFVNLLINQPPCNGDFGNIEISAVNGNINDYNITLYSGNNLIPISENLREGDYQLIIDNEDICPDTFLFQIVQPDLFTIKTISDTLILEGDEIKLETALNLNFSSLEWDPRTLLDCYDCLTPTAQPEVSTVFTLQAISENGCITEESVFVEVLNNEDYFIAVPNIFSPNNDGYNDQLIIEYGGTEIIKNIAIEIYDRYGNLVFKNVDYQTNIFWNGQFNGKNASHGIYTYIVKVQQINNQINNLYGTILLVK